MTEPSNSEEGPTSPIGRFRASTALVIALFPITAAAVRIWIYSGGDTALFLVLLQTVNIAAVLIGTMVLIIPSLITIVAIMALLNPAARRWAHEVLAGHRLVFDLLMPAALLIIGYTVSWTVFVTLASLGLIALLFFLARRAWRKNHRNTASRRRVDKSDAIIPIFSGLLVFLITPSNMWLPLEQITTVQHKQQTVYVLESTTEWTTVLTVDRQVEIVKTREVQKREVCNVKNPGTFALFIQHGGLKEGADCT